MEVKDEENIFIGCHFFMHYSLAYASNSPTIYLNGIQLETSVPTVIENDRTLIPMRDLFESLNRSVYWNPNEYSITSGDIWLQINNPIAYVGGKQITLDVSAKLINDRTYVPIRFITESLGSTVNYNAQNDRIDIINTQSITNEQNTNIELAPPKNFQAAPVSDALIKLTWNTSPGATNYKIYQKSMSNYNSYKEIGETKDTFYNCSGLQSMSEYWFKVKAIGNTNESDYSNEVAATTLDPKNIKTSFASPASIGQHFILNRNGNKIDIALVGIDTGESALNTVLRANMFNQIPSENDRYIIATFRIKEIYPPDMNPAINVFDFEIFNRNRYKYSYSRQPKAGYRCK